MQTIYLDISNKGVSPVIYAKQGEVGRKFSAYITDAGVPYNIPADSLISVWYSGKGGDGNYTHIGENSAFSIDGNVVTVELIAQMLQSDGPVAFCLVVNSSDGSQIGLWNILCLVEGIPGSGSEEATEYYTAFSKDIERLYEMFGGEAGGGSGSSNVVIVTPDPETGKASMTASEIVSELNAGKVVFLTAGGQYVRLEAPGGASIPYGINGLWQDHVGLVAYMLISILEDGSISADTTNMSTSVPAVGEIGNVLIYGENGPEWASSDELSSKIVIVTLDHITGNCSMTSIEIMEAIQSGKIVVYTNEQENRLVHISTRYSDSNGFSYAYFVNHFPQINDDGVTKMVANAVVIDSEGAAFTSGYFELVPLAPYSEAKTILAANETGEMEWVDPATLSGDGGDSNVLVVSIDSSGKLTMSVTDIMAALDSQKIVFISQNEAIFQAFTMTTQANGRELYAVGSALGQVNSTELPMLLMMKFSSSGYISGSYQGLTVPSVTGASTGSVPTLTSAGVSWIVPEGGSSNVVIVTSDTATGKASMTASEIITEINAGKVVLLYADGMYITLSAPAGVPPVNGIATMYDAETRLITHANIYVLDDGTISPDTAKMTTSVPKTGQTGNVLTYGENGPEWGDIDLSGSGDSSIYVGTDEPTDENISIWINPEGDADSDVITTVDEVNALIDEKLGVIENGTY